MKAHNITQKKVPKLIQNTHSFNQSKFGWTVKSKNSSISCPIPFKKAKENHPMKLKISFPPDTELFTSDTITIFPHNWHRQMYAHHREVLWVKKHRLNWILSHNYHPWTPQTCSLKQHVNLWRNLLVTNKRDSNGKIQRCSMQILLWVIMKNYTDTKTKIKHHSTLLPHRQPIWGG